MKLIALVLLGGAVTSGATAAAQESRPNVILIMTDDQGYGDIAAHGNEKIETPNLDTLHSESIRMTDFHVNAICSPTRAALMTGRYCYRSGVWMPVDGRSLMDSNEITIAETFSDAGYQTGLFGKWHLGDNHPLRPQDQGFQEVLCHGGGGITQAADYWGNDYFDDTYLHNGVWEPQEGYCTDVFFTKAMEFMNTCRESDQPFFCYIPTNAPHNPLYIAEEYFQPYLDMGLRDRMARFYGMLTNIDENIGRLRETLAEWGIAENTIVVFITDNGSADGRGPGGHAAGMQGGKGSNHEGGHRVPCFIHWPGGELGEPRDIDTLCAHLDILPTLADLCQVPLINERPLDGSSLVSLLRDEGGEWPERTLVMDSQRRGTPQMWLRGAVLTERWRLLNGTELYDIQENLRESNDLAEEHPEVVAELRTFYEAWWADMSQTFEEPIRMTIGHEAENPTQLCCLDWYRSGGMWNVRTMESNPRRHGYWEVEVAQNGTYRFSLRLRPEYIESAWVAGTATLEVGLQQWTQPVAEGTQTIVFDGIELEAGPARVKATLTEEVSGVKRGAYFTEVERITE